MFCSLAVSSVLFLTRGILAKRSNLTGLLTPFFLIVTLLSVAGRALYGSVVRATNLSLLSVAVSPKFSLYLVSKSAVLLSEQCSLFGGRSMSI